MSEAAVRARAGRAGVASLATLASALRVRQWTKNVLVFAGLLFAAKLGDLTRWTEALLAFAAYCSASSAAYLVNDVRDAGLDRLHPTKRARPVASGRLSVRAALVTAAILGALALVGGAALGSESFLFIAAFVALQLGYSLGLKRVMAVDVLAIAGLFVIRAAAGAEAVEVPVSPWLLACTALLALFLALAKRRGELDRAGTRARRVLSRYSLPILDRLLALVGVAAAVTYSAYAVSARHPYEMAATIPFVAAGIGRYLVLVYRHGLGETPDEILLSDAPLIALIGAWVVTAALVLTLA